MKAAYRLSDGTRKKLSCYTTHYLNPNRLFVVGPSELPSIREKVPIFGKRRRVRNNEKLSVVLVNEDEAKGICMNDYGFFHKPVYMEKWGLFLAELKRLELSWSLFPVAGGGLDLKVIDHMDETNSTLHVFRGKNSSNSSSIADLFEACGSIINGSRQEENIFFKYEKNWESLRLQPIEKENLYPYISTTNSPPIIPKSECPKVALNIFHVNMSNGVSTPLFHSISFQAFCYAFLTSIPSFLKKTDIGVRNLDFVSIDQMSHFRFAWCYLRKEAWMSPLEMEEFNSLLPPK